MSIECSYSTTYWITLKNFYYCSVNIDPSITTQESANITSISGNHLNGKTNSDVSGIYANSKTINYFPRGLETFFMNIKAIEIINCKLKEIHQDDLKPFPKLVEIWLYINSLEVLEEGLFDYNPDLEYIHFRNNKIVHIEPKIFDHLSKLSTLILSSNSCVSKNVENSTSEVKNLIQNVKSQCINSEFSSLKEKLENLEKDSKTLNSEEFGEKLATFEKTFNASKFAKFRPLNYKFEALKKPKFDTTKTLDFEKNLGNMSDLMTKVITNVNDLNIEGIKGSIDGFESTLGVLKRGQSNIADSINQVCTKASLNQVLNQIQENILNLENKISTKIDDSKNINKSSLDNLKSTLNLVQTDLSDSTKTLKTSQDDLKSSIGDIEATLSGLKTSQNDLKSSINKIKNSQNEMKILMDDQKMQKDDNPEDKFKLFGDKIGSLEGQFTDFKSDNAEKLAQIQKELTNTRHKITVTIDEKVKGIEKHLMKKFEEILEEKLGKILEEKLAKFIGN